MTVLVIFLGVRFKNSAIVRITYYEFNMCLDIETQTVIQILISFMAGIRYFDGDRENGTSLASVILSAIALGVLGAILTVWFIFYLWIRYYYQ